MSAIQLSSADAANLAAVTESLLSPLAGPDRIAWWHDVEARLGALFGGARAMITWTEARRVRHYSTQVDTSQLRVLEGFGEADPRTGHMVNYEDIIEHWQRHRRAVRMETWDVGTNFALMASWGFDGPRSRFLNEGLLAAKLHDCFGCSNDLHGSELFFTIGYERAGRTHFRDDARVLRLLLPAFRVAHHTLHTFGARREAIAQTLDAIPDALLVVGHDGRELHRNAALVRALSQDPERAGLERELRLAADALRAPRHALSLATPPERTVVTTLARYTVRATYAPAALWGIDGAVQVSLTASSATPPSADAIARTHGLTSREAEVAALLAKRLRNAELATALGISEHTARRHTERVMEKLGVTSRVEVVRVLGGAGG